MLEGELSLQSEEIKKHNEENCLLTEKYKKVNTIFYKKSVPACIFDDGIYS